MPSLQTLSPHTCEDWAWSFARLACWVSHATQADLLFLIKINNYDDVLVVSQETAVLGAAGGSGSQNLRDRQKPKELRPCV